MKISAPGYTTAWRQVIVPAGGAVVPIDVRLEARGERREVSEGEDLVLSDVGEHSDVRPGGADATETWITRPATLTIPAGTLTAGTNITLTSVGSQSLAGLLPYGWSPLASARSSSKTEQRRASKKRREARGERRVEKRQNVTRDHRRAKRSRPTPLSPSER